jgi:hypothetical protein
MLLCGAEKEEKGERRGRDKVGAHRDTRRAVRAEERRSIPPGEDKRFPKLNQSLYRFKTHTKNCIHVLNYSRFSLKIVWNMFL